ncbi:MAG: hypothetical protein ACE5J3_04570 [Methanosarcinales archaeon]
MIIHTSNKIKEVSIFSKENEVKLKAKPTIAYTIDKVGLYTVKASNFTKKFAVNLVNPSESNITPAKYIIEEKNKVGSPESNMIKTNQELWKYFAFVALLLFIPSCERHTMVCLSQEGISCTWISLIQRC